MGEYFIVASCCLNSTFKPTESDSKLEANREQQASSKPTGSGKNRLSRLSRSSQQEAATSVKLNRKRQGLCKIIESGKNCLISQQETAIK